jgi:hypothetical protein
LIEQPLAAAQPGQQVVPATRRKLLVFHIALSDAGSLSRFATSVRASIVPKSIQRATLFFLGIALTSLAAVADEKAADDERRYLTALVEARDLRIDQIRQKMAEASGTSKKSSTTRKASSKKRQINRSAAGSKTRSDEPAPSTLKQMREDLNRLKSGETVPEIRNLTSREPDSLGLLDWRCRVFQISGPSDMMVDFGFDDKLYGRIWIHGFPTKNYVDDQTISIKGLAAVDGTKSYTTVTGARATVVYVRALESDRQKVIEKYQAQCKASYVPEVEPESAAKATAKASDAAASSDPDAAARKKFAGILSNSKNLIKAGLREQAKVGLNRIITEAPGTSIATEAKKELDDLP